MRKFGKESTAPSEGVSRESGAGWLQNHGALAVCIIALLAFVLRTVFAYGVSADGDFALSGGSEAQYHLHVVESILNGSFIFGSDAAANYPIGGLNINPPLYDMIAAGIGSFAGASFALAVLAPIFGALTVFPVYLVGKELKGVTTGVVAALIYALMALPISASVFSNGTEFAFTAFLFAFFILMMIKLVRKVNENELAVKEAAIAGLFLGLIALSWNGFRMILVLLIIVMVIQIVLDRFNSKDFKVPLYSYSIVMVIGVAIGAVYYIPAGLWDAVFSGPVLITLVAVVFGFLFRAVSSKPWIFTIPAFIVAFAAVAVILFFIDSDLCTALLVGNDAYINPLMDELARTSVSISTMSSYYGWLLMWMPFALGLYEFYVYARKDRSHKQLFLVMLLLVPWFFAWTSYGAAVVAGPVFALASSIVIFEILSRVDLKAYWASMKNAGFPGLFRKMIKPVPLLTVLVAAFLVILPGAVYAVDAGISSNEDYGYFAYGNTTYTIETGESYPMSYIYDDLKLMDDDSAVLTWINTAADVEAAGYSTVNDRFGDGASAAAQIYLAEGAAGATAAQIIRVICANTDSNFAQAFQDYPGLYAEIKAYIDDPSSAVDEVLKDTSVYGNINSDVMEENAVYLVTTKLITDTMSTAAIMDAYDSVCGQSSDRIGYYLVDGSMVPLAYGDGDSLSTMAYFAGYSTDSYGAATQFYSLITYYSNYYPAMATDALYDTFMWKALIGPSPEYMGYTSSFSYLYDLASSNGTVKTMPGYGLAGYNIVSWYVKYNEKANATSEDDGWNYVTHDKAVELQSKNGGTINYLSSMILYEYSGIGFGSATYSSKVVNEYNEPLDGITVQVTSFNSKYEATTVYSETKTDKDGNFTVQVPNDYYMVTFKSGNVDLQTTTTAAGVQVDSAKFKAVITVGDNIDYSKYKYVLEKGDFKAYVNSVLGIVNSAVATDGEGNYIHIAPGQYSYKLIDDTAATVASGTVTLYAGENPALMISPKTYTITATVTDYFGNSVASGTVVAMNATTYLEYSAAIEDGKAVITVPAGGTYTVSLTDGYVCASTTSLILNTNRTVSITAYEANEVTITNPVDTPLTAYGGNFSITVEGGTMYLPTSIGAQMYAFTIYGVDASNVYWAEYKSGSSVTLNTAKAYKVSGSIEAEGSVTFYDSDMMFTAKTDKDGKFAIMLPAKDYKVWAYTDSNRVYLGNASVKGDTDLGALELENGRKVTATYQYASGTSKSNVGLPFTPICVTMSYGSTVWTVPAVTDTTGKATFAIPVEATGLSVIANNGSISNDAFEATGLNYNFEKGTSAVTATITIAKEKLVKHTIANDYTITIKPYGEETETTIIGPTELAPGQYTAKINANTGYYFDGTIYVYPGKTVFDGLNVIEVYGVKIDKYELDDLEITGEKSHSDYNKDGIYYFEYDCEYFLTTKNPSTGYMKNGYLYVAKGGSAPASMDMKTEGRVNEIKGFVSAIADGEVTVLYNGDVKVVAEVKSGAFTVDLPETVTSADFYAEVTKTIASQKFGFEGYLEVTDFSSKTVNIPVYSNQSVADFNGDLDACIIASEFHDGKAKIGLRIYNNTDTVKAYAVTSGTALVLDKVVQVIIPANSVEEVVVEGAYEPNGTGIGSVGMSVIVSDFNGSSSLTLKVLNGATWDNKSSITMKTAADCDNKDKLSGAEYMYALTFVNEGQTDRIKIDVTTEAGYNVALMTQNGEYIEHSGSEFIIAAQSTTIIYAKVMKIGGDMDKAPSITVNADVTGGSVTISPSTIDVEVESMTVSGDTAVDQKSGIPLGVWFILGVSILLLILIVWMGSKRGGVFSRR